MREQIEQYTQVSDWFIEQLETLLVTAKMSEIEFQIYESLQSAANVKALFIDFTPDEPAPLYTKFIIITRERGVQFEDWDRFNNNDTLAVCNGEEATIEQLRKFILSQ